MGALAIDTTLIEPNRPRIIRKEIALRRWPARLEGFTIAHLSDFHYDPFCSVHPLRASIHMVNQLRPDLIALTGDFVSEPFLRGDRKKAAAAVEPCSELLRQMQAPHGLWAVLGNHDIRTDSNRIITSLHSQSIHVLVNQSTVIERDGARFWLAGIDDALEGTADLNNTLRKIPADEAVVLLAHEPDFADDAARYPVDLQLSGHSHGGQVRLPWLPPLLLPDLARKYVWGLYEIGGLKLYTNAGLGTVNLPIRMNCPPEITLLTIRRSSAA